MGISPATVLFSTHRPVPQLLRLASHFGRHPPTCLSQCGKELESDKREHCTQTKKVIPTNGARQPTLLRSGVHPRSKAHGIWVRAKKSQSDRYSEEEQGSEVDPPPLTTAEGLEKKSQQPYQHHGSHGMAHRPRASRDPLVIGGDRTEDLFRQCLVPPPLAKQLHVEHQIHPKDPQQKSTADQGNRRHDLPLSLPLAGFAGRLRSGATPCLALQNSWIKESLALPEHSANEPLLDAACGEEYCAQSRLAS